MMPSFVRKLFGFRSGSVWKTAIATIWYLFTAFGLLFSLVATPQFECTSLFDLILFRAYLFVGLAGMLLVPILLSDFSFCRQIPLFNSNSVPLRVIGAFLVLTVFAGVSSAINGAHSPEYVANSERYAALQATSKEKRQDANSSVQAEPSDSQSPDSGQEENNSDTSASDAADADNKYQEDFVKGLMKGWGFTQEQALEVYRVLSNVGCGNIELMDDEYPTNTDLDVVRGMVGKHQVNITTENKRVFYIQITGFDGKKSYDLYDSDTVEGGYSAYYYAEDDTVIPWGEW